MGRGEAEGRGGEGRAGGGGVGVVEVGTMGGGSNERRTNTRVGDILRLWHTLTA